MIFVLSPAKNLDYESPVQTDVLTKPFFEEETKALIKKLQKLKPAAISDLMNLSPKLADLNYERYQNFKFESPENVRQAAVAFNGDAYLGLNANSLTKEEVEYAQDHLRILSGLYGLLKPMDAIQPYRLEMGTKLEVNTSKKNLYEFWDTKITSAINKALDATDSECLVNLASNEYFKAIKIAKLKKPVITINFKEKKGDTFKVIMVYAKKARGMMARYLIKNKVTDLEQIKLFDVEGYMFNETLSEEENWVFTR